MNREYRQKKAGGSYKSIHLTGNSVHAIILGCFGARNGTGLFGSHRRFAP